MTKNEMVGDAMREYFEKIGLTQTDAAGKANVDRSRLSHMINGKINVSPKTAAKLAKTFGFSIPFLIHGEGSLFTPNEPQVMFAAGEDAASLKAQIAALERENEWLRSLVEKAAIK